jgi:hypothetical protein
MFASVSVPSEIVDSFGLKRSVRSVAGAVLVCGVTFRLSWSLSAGGLFQSTILSRVWRIESPEHR